MNVKDKAEQNALREAFEEKKRREKYLKNADQRRIMLYEFINSDFFNRVLLATIIIRYFFALCQSDCQFFVNIFFYYQLNQYDWNLYDDIRIDFRPQRYALSVCLTYSFCL